MKTVLIVEDEKLIRQGLRKMIQRSGVPVEVIMECNNGETALEILKEQSIDVMFTDIRMPKMDGIELVERMQECYDDFNYAVAMMHNGVLEYLLKPIEREKICDILARLNQEIEEGREQEKTRQKLGQQQIRHLMLLAEMPEEELTMLETQYDQHFILDLSGKPYVVCCRNRKKEEESCPKDCLFLGDVEGNDLFLIEAEALSDRPGEYPFLQEYTGISRPHQGIRELREAYLEAREMRRCAFCTNRSQMRYGQEMPLVADEMKLQRVQLLGTDRTEELQHVWTQFFYEVKHGRIGVRDFEECMTDFLTETLKTYRNVLEEKENCGEINEITDPFGEDAIDRYEQKVLAFVTGLQARILSQFDTNGNQQKMKQAVAYIEEHYASDLNMAVVSNYLSMNYSLFSYSFKQYTGSNFVNYLRDIRMKEAKRLLAGTDMRIAEISQAVGYENEKHFMKLFKGCCGVSPSEYRRNMGFTGDES